MANRTEQMIAAGGRLWERDGMTRVYFNDLAARIGFDYTVGGKRGFISSASLRGERLSNNKANDLRLAIDGAKIYYDAADDQIHTARYDGGKYDAEFNGIVDSITAAAVV